MSHKMGIFEINPSILVHVHSNLISENEKREDIKNVFLSP